MARAQTQSRTPQRRAPLEEMAAAADVPIVPWSEVEPEFLGMWAQGDHLIELGKTGQGKSTLAYTAANGLHDLRGASCAGFITKKADSTSTEQGWPIITEWPPTYRIRRGGKVLLWPKYTKASTNAKDNAPALKEALDAIMDEGNWVLYLDEASYLVQSMHLRVSIDELFTQSRSNGITLIAGSQRPVWVSRGEVSQHTWVACFKIGDEEEAIRAGEVLGDRGRFGPLIPCLQPHQFLLLNTNSDEGVITMVGT